MDYYTYLRNLEYLNQMQNTFTDIRVDNEPWPLTFQNKSSQYILSKAIEHVKEYITDENKILIGGLKTDIDWLEWQANYFAASILMPRELIQKYYQENISKIDIDKMAIEISNLCGVSKQAAKIRLNDVNENQSLKNQLSLSEIK